MLTHSGRWKCCVWKGKWPKDVKCHAILGRTKSLMHSLICSLHPFLLTCESWSVVVNTRVHSLIFSIFTGQATAGGYQQWGKTECQGRGTEEGRGEVWENQGQPWGPWKETRTGDGREEPTVGTTAGRVRTVCWGWGGRCWSLDWEMTLTLRITDILGSAPDQQHNSLFKIP